MVERVDCIEEILNLIKDRRDKKFVRDNLDEIWARAEADDTGDEWGRKVAQAAREMLEEQAVRSAVLRRNIRMDALTFRDNKNYIDAVAKNKDKKGNYILGIEGRNVGTNTQFFDPKSRFGNQLSAGAMGGGTQRLLVGGAWSDMERAGLHKIFSSGEIEDKVFIEKVELERQGAGYKAKVGRTGDKNALKIAEILQKWDNKKVDMLNSAGGWVEKNSAWGMTVLHDPDLIRRAGQPVEKLSPSTLFASGTDISKRVAENPLRALNPATYFYKGFTEADRDAWVAKTLPKLDVKKTFGSLDPTKTLQEMYGGLVTGDHLKMTTVADEPIFANMARKVSAHRELVWKSAEDQLAYMKEFGRFKSPTEAWLRGMMVASNRYALMKTYGSRPKQGFEELIAYGKNLTKGKEEGWSKAADDYDRGWLRNQYAVLSGEADIPIHNMAATLVRGATAVQRMAKLGLTPFAMLQDNTTISRELARQGLTFLDRNQTILSDYFRGGNESYKRQVAQLMHTNILGRLRGAMSRFDISDAKPGNMAWLENKFFEISGITAMTENKREAAERMMANHMGEQRGKKWTELGDEERGTLQSFGLGDKEWDLLHKAEWTEVEGEKYLTPDIPTKLSDADVTAYLKETKPVSFAQAANAAKMTMQPSMSEAERVRNDLAMKLWSYYSERGKYSVLEVGAREKATLYQGTQAGSPLNLALRLIMQFKQFPTAMITKAWGADLYGSANSMGKIAGITELVISSTLYGMMANYLNQLVKGQNPNAQLQKQPAQFILAGFMRGGAGSIYGDFLLGEWSRFGLSASATLAGPVVGQLDRAAELWSDVTHLKMNHSAGALALRMVRDNTPFANMIYTKWLVDYAIMYRLQEWMNPGYLSRYEQQLKDKQGIEFYFRPSQYAR